MNVDTLQLSIPLLLLLLVANGTPIVLKRLLGSRLRQPIDAGRMLSDGRPLLGASKTWRGLIGGVLAAAATAPLLGFSWEIGARIGAGAMLGDLLSSFVKRRLGIAPSGRATGLDQIPEALIPLWLCRAPLELSVGLILTLVALFLVGELLLSRLLYRAGIRDRPY